MKLESSLRQPSGLLHLAPVIDAVVILLIFFLLGSNFVVQSGLAVTLPESSSQLSSFSGASIVTVSAGKNPQIFLDGIECDLASLPSLVDKEKLPRGRRSAVLRVDEQATYGLVMRVSTILLEAGYDLGHATAPLTPE